MLVVFASYGNDSIALLQYVREREHAGPVLVAYSDTGWASEAWSARVERAEAWVRSLGWAPHRIASEGMEALVRRKKGWPRNGMQFCTEELKIKPAMAWLDAVDPDKEATCAVGVRREESPARRTWPEWTEESDKHGGRSLWAPLVRCTEVERDALLARAGWEPLPHRSMECAPCVNANRADLRQIDDATIDRIEAFEQSLGFTSNGKPRTMFRPAAKMGAVGIRESVKWARSAHGKYKTPLVVLGAKAGCDSGFCGS